MAVQYDPDGIPYDDEQTPAPAPAPTPAAQSRGWQWELATPSQAPRSGYYWDWQGGWDQNGQGWQEVPIGGWNNPQTDDPLVSANNTSDTNEYGLNWWQAKGYESNDIFDIRTGQLKPGWVRTARGYENPSITFGGPPPSDPGPSGPGPSGPGPGGTTSGPYAGGGSPAFQGQYNFPSLSLDRVSYEDYVPGEKFTRGDPFAAPDPASIQNDPSYQWRYDQGLATQKRKGANSGTFFGGATMKALQGWGQNYASNEYKDIYSRAADVYDRNLSGKFNEWKSNEDQRFNSWNANRGLAFDTVNTNNAAKTNEFAPQQRWAELTFGRDFDLYKYMNDDAFRYSDLDARIKMAQAAAGRETP